MLNSINNRPRLHTTHLLRRLALDDTLYGHEGCVNTLTTNTHGTLLLSAADDLMLNVWNIDQGNLITSVDSGHYGNVLGAQFVPCSGSSEVYSCAADAQVRHVNLTTETRRVWKCHKRSIHCVQVRPENPFVFYSCSEDHTVRFFDIREEHSCGTGTCEKNVLLSQDQAFYSLALNPRNLNYFTVSAKGGLVAAYDIRNLGTNPENVIPAVLYCLPDNPRILGASGVAYNHDGSEIVASYMLGDIGLFDAITGISVKLQKPFGLESSPFTHFDRTSPEIRKQWDHRWLVQLEGKLEKKDSSDSDYEEMPDLGFSDEDIDSATIDEEKLLDEPKLNQNNEGKEENISMDKEKNLPIPQLSTPKQRYFGHISVKNIKNISFFGPESEFIVTGSDDGYCYMWNKKSGDIQQHLFADEASVKFVLARPNSYDLITSGVESSIKIFRPLMSVETDLSEVRNHVVTNELQLRLASAIVSHRFGPALARMNE